MKKYILEISNKFCKRTFTTSIINRSKNNIRNIGIMAHIDAGKTTTTERMLYYCGHSKHVGEVHDGDTIMDYLPQERERGITITSAAITFSWKDNKINLVDTPGHVDFSMEVEKSLRVLDGAVAVFDGSAGVEAQSITVWEQANKYEIPKICYINKMDKMSSNLELCVNEINKKLEANSIVLHEPIGGGKNFSGVVDIISMKKFSWNTNINDKGISYYMSNLSEKDGKLWEICKKKRGSLTEKLSDLDNRVAEAVIEKESNECVSSKLLKEAIRRCTINQEICPVFIGSSYKNIGVQLLMDGIVDYLPSPNEKLSTVEKYFKSSFLYVFKIIHHKKMGALFFCRIYKGQVQKGQKIFNFNNGCVDKVEALYIPYADEFEPVMEVNEGNIVALSGLKTTRTGDILVRSGKDAEITKRMATDENVEILSDLGFTIPQPVVLCSVEAPSVGQQHEMDEALIRLQREDPSIRVKFDENTQQTILSGMGELHLEIIKDRILKEYKVNVSLGKTEVAYKETVTDTNSYLLNYNKAVLGSKQNVVVELSLVHRSGAIFDKVKLATKSENVKNFQDISRQRMDLINKGVEIGLSNGPTLGYPVTDVDVYLHWFDASKISADSIITSVVSNCIREVLKTSENFVLEPIMRIEITTPDKYSNNLVSDINKRRGQVGDVVMKKNLLVISAECPLSELVGYSTRVRKISSGYASLSMELAFYSKLTDELVAEIKSKMYL